MRTAFVKEFLEFLKEYKVVSLAIAFVMGSASTALVNSFVKDILMPVILPLASTGPWRDAAFVIGPVRLAYGSFFAELINFLALAAVVFIVVKKIIKEDRKNGNK